MPNNWSFLTSSSIFKAMFHLKVSSDSFDKHEAFGRHQDQVDSTRIHGFELIGVVWDSMGDKGKGKRGN